MDDEPKPVWLQLDFVTSIRNPFESNPWGSGLVTHKMVDEAEPNPEPWNPDDVGQRWTVEQQAGRIKWLADNGWDDPIQIDVGVPVMGYCCQTILDGHHRLAAAIYRQDEFILCSVDGQTDVFERYIRDRREASCPTKTTP